MYSELSEEIVNKALKKISEISEKQPSYVIWGSAELIDAIEKAIEKEFYMMIMPSELEQKIIDLREEGHTYKGIQLKLGNPSKKFIKETLKKYRPDLAGDVVANPGKLKNQLYG